MSEKIVIDKATNTVRHIKEIISKEVTLKQFIEEGCLGAGLTIPFLPSSTRGFLSSSSHTGFIVESNPCMRGINFKVRGSSSFTDYHKNMTISMFDRPVNLPIWMPYIYWIVGITNNPISMQGVAFAFSLQRAVYETSALGFMAFPNIQQSDTKSPVGVMCTGAGFKVNDDDLDFHNCVDRIVTALFSTNFNSDYFHPDKTKFQIPALEHAVKKYCSDDVLDAELKEYLPLFAKVEDYLLNGSDGTAKLKLYEIPVDIRIKYAINYNTVAADNKALKYLYAWHRLSQDITLEEFLKIWSLPKIFLYSELIDYLRNLLDRLEGRRTS